MRSSHISQRNIQDCHQRIKKHWKQIFSAPLDNKPLIFIFIFFSACLWSERQRKKIIWCVREWKAGHKQFFSRYGVLCSLMFNTWGSLRCHNIFFRQQNMSPRSGNRMKDNWKIASACARIANQISTAPASTNDKTKFNLLTCFNGISTFTEPENQYFHTQRLTDTET